MLRLQWGMALTVFFVLGFSVSGVADPFFPMVWTDTPGPVEYLAPLLKEAEQLQRTGHSPDLEQVLSKMGIGMRYGDLRLRHLNKEANGFGALLRTVRAFTPVPMSKAGSEDSFAFLAPFDGKNILFISQLSDGVEIVFEVARRAIEESYLKQSGEIAAKPRARLSKRPFYWLSDGPSVTEWRAAGLYYWSRLDAIAFTLMSDLANKMKEELRTRLQKNYCSLFSDYLNRLHNPTVKVVKTANEKSEPTPLAEEIRKSEEKIVSARQWLAGREIDCESSLESSYSKEMMNPARAVVRGNFISDTDGCEVEVFPFLDTAQTYLLLEYKGIRGAGLTPDCRGYQAVSCFGDGCWTETRDLDNSEPVPFVSDAETEMDRNIQLPSYRAWFFYVQWDGEKEETLQLISLENTKEPSQRFHLVKDQERFPGSYVSMEKRIWLLSNRYHWSRDPISLTEPLHLMTSGTGRYYEYQAYYRK